MHGKWLTLARTAWVLFAVFYIAAYLVTIPITLSETPQFTSQTDGITQAEFLTELAQLGISPDGYIIYSQWLGVVVPLLYIALGLYIFWRKSGDLMALLTSSVLIAFLSPFSTLARLNAIWTLPGTVSDVTITIITVLWFFIFPDGHFVPRWTRWIFFLLLAIQVWRIFQPDVYLQNFPLVGLTLFGGILISQVYRYRHAGAAQRQQIKWVVYGIVVGVLPLVVFFILYFAFIASLPSVRRTVIVDLIGGQLWELLLIILPVSLTFAILRSRLFDIDVIIRKTLTYVLVVALLAIVYFGSVILLQQLFASVTGQRSQVITILSTLTIAALFVPLRNRIQDFIDKRFYRKKYNAQQVLSDFANIVRDETDLEKLTARLIEVVQETMQPTRVSVWLNDREHKTK